MSRKKRPSEGFEDLLSPEEMAEVEEDTIGINPDPEAPTWEEEPLRSLLRGRRYKIPKDFFPNDP